MLYLRRPSDKKINLGKKAMHETGLALEIVELALDALESSEKTPRVEALHLKIGRWSGVEPDTLTFALQVVCHETPLEGAKAIIEMVEPAFECRDCGKTFTPADRFDHCPHCGGPPGRMTAGDEFMLTAIDVED